MIQIPSPNANHARIVIVDDHDIVRLGLSTVLSTVPGWQIAAELGDAAAALDYLTRQPVDVMLVDLSLGKENGLDLIRDAVFLHPELAILVITMHDELIYSERVFRLGARGYIMKHKASDQLIPAVRTLLAGGTVMSQAVQSQLLRHLRPGASQDRAGLSALSERETEILGRIGKGQSTKQIAYDLDLSNRTVDAHRANIRRKLGARTTADLLRYGLLLSGT